MENSIDKLEWSKPEIYILDFKKTSDGFIEAEFEDAPDYVGEQEGS
jgi:hypothetical protein